MMLSLEDFQTQSFDSAKKVLAEVASNAIDLAMPGCMILDVRMPEMDGPTLQKELLAREISIPIIFLTAHGDVPLAVETLKRGAWYFLEKPFDPQRLVSLVRKALDVSRVNRERNLARSAARQILMSLTPREREVADKIAAGLSTKMIAVELGSSPHTVAHQRARIFDKADVGSSVELANLLRDAE